MRLCSLYNYHKIRVNIELLFIFDHLLLLKGHLLSSPENMSGVGEASLVLGIISSIISIIDATYKFYTTVEDEKGLPKNFKKSAASLPLIMQLLEDAQDYISSMDDETTKAAFVSTLQDCELRAKKLQDLFSKVMPDDKSSRLDRYLKAARTIGKGGRVESLMKGILDDMQLMTSKFPDRINKRKRNALDEAIEDVSKMEPSLPDGFEEASAFTHYGSGAQNNNTGSGIQHINSGSGHPNSGAGIQYIGTNHIGTPSTS
ncbi:hypothetical protein ACMFMF_000958 [Clarireedia jacksonii]